MDRKKVLVIRFSSIGDIVLTSPIVRTIAIQKKWDVHFITKAKYKNVVAGNPHISKIYTFEKEVTEITTELKKEDYDLIIDLHKNLRSQRLRLILGKPSVSFNKLNIQKWLMVNFKINLLPELHLVDRYFKGVEKLGVINDGQGLDYYYSKNNISIKAPELPYVVIALGATYVTKRIQTKQLHDTIEGIKHKVVIVGGNDVLEEANELENKYPNIINYVGKINLDESAYLVHHSEYVITGDTGMMHISAALKKPMLLFWGSTHKSLGMYPYYGDFNIPQIDILNPRINCSPCTKIGNDKCPKGHFRCMKGIQKNEIHLAISDIECK